MKHCIHGMSVDPSSGKDLCLTCISPTRNEDEPMTLVDALAEEARRLRDRIAELEETNRALKRVTREWRQDAERYQRIIMSDHKEIWLQPECCEHDAPEDCEEGVPWTRYVNADEITRLQAENEALQKQLPDEMQDCTILFKECEKGHGRLIAKNWIDHGCHWCENEALQKRIAESKSKYDDCKETTLDLIEGNEKLRGRIAELESERDYFKLWRKDDREVLEQRIAELESERDQAEKNFAGAVKDYHKFEQDAERYRWLRSTRYISTHLLGDMGSLKFQALDEAIDATREK